ncbi:MAG: crossover junction endodeoxyribonuclease RuvC [Sphingomonadaceae bacterium]
MRLILGLDPGLARTGWGIIAAQGNRLTHVAHGAIVTDPAEPLARRLVRLYDGLAAMLAAYHPHEAAIEEVFLNRNAQSTLKLGHARGVVMLAAAGSGVPLSEYATRLVKKAVVGTGAADKIQVAAMVARLLPGCGAMGADEADALAVGIAHSHLAATARRMATA